MSSQSSREDGVEGVGRVAGDGKNVTEYGRLLGEFEDVCPVCGGPLKVREVEYMLPSLGKTLLVSKKCAKCGYKRTDIVPLSFQRHTRVYLRVEKKEDLYIKVVRSPTARIFIPELGLELRPGLDAEMFVTNVEGVLQLFKDALLRLKTLDEEARVDDMVKLLDSIAEGDFTPFTLILDDVYGVSAVIAGPHSRVAIENAD